MAEDYKRKLVNYFKKNLRKGYTGEALHWALVNQGYSRILIESAYEVAIKELAQEAPVVKEKPKISYTLVDEYDQPVKIRKKPWWKRLFKQ